MDPAVIQALSNIGSAFGIASILAYVNYLIVKENRADIKESREELKQINATLLDVVRENTEASTVNTEVQREAARASTKLSEKVTEVILRNTK